MGEPRREREAGRDPSAGEVLAAVDRAARHRDPGRGSAPVWSVLEHLAIARRTAASRQVQRRLGELEARGLLACGREHGVPSWSLTRAGLDALAQGVGEALPESPRHRSWRHARAAARQELPRFRAGLARSLAEADRLLALTTAVPERDDASGPTGGAKGAGPRPPVRPGPPTGHDWMAIGRVLAGDCRRLASAWHCLHEWEEPGDEDGGRPAAGQDDAMRRAELAALRNVRLWREPG
jgi:hypothetical protein